MTDKTFSRMSKAHNQHAAMSQNWALANPLSNKWAPNSITGILFHSLFSTVEIFFVKITLVIRLL